MTPDKVIEASHLINQLTSALAADLAATTRASSITVRLEFSIGTGVNPTLYIPATAITDWLTRFIKERLVKLADLGIDTMPLLAPYEEALNKALSTQPEHVHAS